MTVAIDKARKIRRYNDIRLFGPGPLSDLLRLTVLPALKFFQDELERGWRSLRQHWKGDENAIGRPEVFQNFGCFVAQPRLVTVRSAWSRQRGDIDMLRLVATRLRTLGICRAKVGTVALPHWIGVAVYDEYAFRR
ncbi:hypothetical protein GCM10008942_07570 [Rhizomicrobium electricum]|uniref:Uncharacterized protein n=1 Tax=Rhizomicrobium electricum TaxID=480070 RepID=A0ABN1E8W6_9PROT